MKEKIKEKWAFYTFVASILALEFLVIEFYTIAISYAIHETNGFVFFLGQLVFATAWLKTLNYLVWQPELDVMTERGDFDNEYE